MTIIGDLESLLRSTTATIILHNKPSRTQWLKTFILAPASVGCSGLDSFRSDLAGYGAKLKWGVSEGLSFL